MNKTISWGDWHKEMARKDEERRTILRAEIANAKKLKRMKKRKGYGPNFFIKAKDERN